MSDGRKRRGEGPGIRIIARGRNEKVRAGSGTDRDRGRHGSSCAGNRSGHGNRIARRNGCRSRIGGLSPAVRSRRPERSTGASRRTTPINIAAFCPICDSRAYSRGCGHRHCSRGRRFERDRCRRRGHRIWSSRGSSAATGQNRAAEENYRGWKYELKVALSGHSLLHRDLPNLNTSAAPRFCGSGGILSRKGIPAVANIAHPPRSALNSSAYAAVVGIRLEPTQTQYSRFIHRVELLYTIYLLLPRRGSTMLSCKFCTFGMRCRTSPLLANHLPGLHRKESICNATFSGKTHATPA